MYGRWIEVKIGADVDCRVLVFGTPTMPEERWLELALEKMRHAILALA